MNLECKQSSSGLTVASSLPLNIILISGYEGFPDEIHSLVWNLHPILNLISEETNFSFLHPHTCVVLPQYAQRLRPPQQHTTLKSHADSCPALFIDFCTWRNICRELCKGLYLKTARSLLANTFQSLAQNLCSKIHQHSEAVSTFRMMNEEFRICSFFHDITQPGLQSPGTITCLHEERIKHQHSHLCHLYQLSTSP